MSNALSNPDPKPNAEPSEFPKAYEPLEVEKRWYDVWEKLGVFRASDDPADKRPVYTIPMPPPNVTGSLHMGHALQCTWQDALTRYHRMRGYNALWQPGTDHAGIATQTVVERLLAREGTTRHAIGREEFMKRIWAWKEQSGGRISVQQRVLGSTPDWSRSKFTMDADQNRAVIEAFVRLYEEGLIYRATRLINWCPECQTALSDLEVETEEGANGELFEFAYVVEGSDDRLVVATTRPETMLGDTAVAVHPDDPRYKHLHGKMLVHPFVDRKVPVITDAILVDMKFGTGAVKVTPAHDFNDFATGKRNGLEEINIFNLDGTMNDNAGQFKGLERKRARTAVKKALEEKGLAVGSKPHKLNIPKCQRTGGVVEPMISTQWFCKTEGMAKAALEAVRSGETKIVPEEWEKTYEYFLGNIQDWCISRQLWWGHQIPAWFGPNGEIKVGRTKPPECGDDWTQDPDVLDTWFSSALWPFATLGWPEKTPALEKFYPASDLETGYDIIFFWVARMMMFGIHFMGKAPFKRVILSGLIVDETGDKMSKVKGNGIDPLDLIHGATFKEVVAKNMPGVPEAEALQKFKKSYPSTITMGEGFPAFGADALRMTLATFAPSVKRIALAPKRIEGYRFFANKMWNATRFSMEHTGNVDAKALAFGSAPKSNAFYNQWILSRLSRTTDIALRAIDEVRLDEAVLELYRFFWTDLCDWFLELAKISFQTENDWKDLGGITTKAHVDETRATLVFVLEQSFRLIHPFMPYVTEELWQRLVFPTAALGTSGKTIALEKYPSPTDFVRSESLEQDMDLLQKTITGIRGIRGEYDLKSEQVVVSLRTEDPRNLALIESNRAAIAKLCRADLRFEKPGAERAAGTVSGVVPSDRGPIEIHIHLKGIVTKDKELDRIARETKRIEKELATIQKKLNSPGFVDRAPPEVVAESKTQELSMVDALSRLKDAAKLVDEL